MRQFIRKSGLIPRRSAAAVSNHSIEVFSIKIDGIINFLSNEPPVKLSNAYRYTAACRWVVHYRLSAYGGNGFTA
jgi:hypothetical protein